MGGLEILVPIMAGAVVLVLQAMWRSRSDDTWRAAASSLGLTFEASSLTGGPKITGHLDHYAVTVEVKRGGGGSNNNFTIVTVDGGTRIPNDIALASETFWSGLDVLGQEIVVGEKEFDDLVRVRGVESTLLAVLTGEARVAVAELVRVDRGVVKDGHVTSSRPGHERDGNKIEARVRRMVRIARLMSIREQEIPERLAQNVQEDPSSGVRHRNLDYLRRFFWRHAKTMPAAEAALTDKSHRVRLLAGRICGGRGIDALQGLVDDPTSPRDVAAEAFGLLAERLPRADLEPRTLEVLRSPNDPLVIQALLTVRRERLIAARARVTGLLEGRRTAVVAAAARAMGIMDDTRTTRVLLPLLDHDEDEVKIAACAALGEAGTIDAVETLMDHAKGLFKNAQLKSAARAAIEAIQGRVGGAEGADGGRLSVIDPEQEGLLSVVATKDPGALSVAGGEAGEVAIVDDDDQ
ncbi:MAG: HEAT repeat domain-containing protein [Deltaproteobacteria bacterium]